MLHRVYTGTHLNFVSLYEVLGRVFAQFKAAARKNLTRVSEVSHHGELFVHSLLAIKKIPSEVFCLNMMTTWQLRDDIGALGSDDCYSAIEALQVPTKLFSKSYHFKKGRS
jgi:hypothetical protein